jgi:hypothetical protein
MLYGRRLICKNLCIGIEKSLPQGKKEKVACGKWISYFKGVDLNIVCSKHEVCRRLSLYITQIFRYARACYTYENFLKRDQLTLLTKKLILQGYNESRLKSSFCKFYGTYNCDYKLSLCVTERSDSRRKLTKNSTVRGVTFLRAVAFVRQYGHLRRLLFSTVTGRCPDACMI